MKTGQLSYTFSATMRTCFNLRASLPKEWIQGRGEEKEVFQIVGPGKIFHQKNAETTFDYLYRYVIVAVLRQIGTDKVTLEGHACRLLIEASK